MKNRSLTTINLFLLSLTLIISCGTNDKDGSNSSAESDLPSVVSSGGASAVADSTVNLAVQGTMPQPGLALVGEPLAVYGIDGSVIGSLSLIDARLVLEKISLKGMDESDDTLAEESGVVSPEFEGPYVVDLLTNVLSPEPENIAIPQGLYNRVKLGVHKAEGAESTVLGLPEGDPLIGNSIYVFPFEFG